MDSHHIRSDGTNNDADVVIIGAGVVGCACALSLSQQGLRVLVVDSQQSPGSGASYGNAGHIATEQVFPIADATILKRIPKMLLDPMGPLRLDWRHLPKALPWFSRLLLNLRKTPYQASTLGIRALNEQSLNAWARLLDTIDGRYLLKQEGSFLVYEQESSAEAISVLSERMSAQNVALEYWRGSAIREFAPQLTDNIKGGLFFPETAHVVNPGEVVDSLISASKENGVQFKQGEVIAGQVFAEGVKLTTTNAGSITADKVLIACGAYSAELTKILTGVKVPLDTERGYHLMLPHEQNRLPVAVTSLERRFIMTPMNTGLRLAGTVEFAGLNRPANMQRAWQLKKLSQGLFQSDLNTGDAKAWMGRRPSLPDSLPIIDSVQQDRVLLAFGHHHLGLTQAAITAEVISRLVTKKDNETLTSRNQTPVELSPYRLNRFA